MNYFHPYPLHVDDNVTAAWKSQVAEATTMPALAELLAQRDGELFPRFVAAYSELRALPRGARRALQRRLARSRELSDSLREWLQQRSVHGLQQKLARSLAGAALLLVLGRGVSDAATITVDATAPGVAADLKCSLIEAINNANDTVNGRPFTDCAAGDPAGEDTIVLPKKTFTLTTPYGYYYSDYTGLPLITSQITIEGNGAKITRKKSAPSFRLMAVDVNGELELKNVTLSGGVSFGYYGGGAIVNYGETTISSSTITGNTASFGGAVSNSGSLTVQNSTISKNTAKGYLTAGYYYGGGGGGIGNFYGDLTITNSTITGNKAVAGGGILNYGGNMELTGATVSKNTALYAGGIGNYGYAPTQTIANSTITGNKANLKTIKYSGYTYFIGGVGGGVVNFGYLTISNSNITGNKATGKIIKRKASGYTYSFFYSFLHAGKGGGVYNAGTLYLNGGTVTGNSATCYGGGIFNGGVIPVNTSNVSGNKAKYGPDTYP